MADKEVLLTALNIKAMSFSPDDNPEAGAPAGEASRPKTGSASSNRSKVKPQQAAILGDLVEVNADGNEANSSRPVNLIVDLAFASNVRFLDDHELHLDNVELYKVSTINCLWALSAFGGLLTDMNAPTIDDHLTRLTGSAYSNTASGCTDL